MVKNIKIIDKIHLKKDEIHIFLVKMQKITCVIRFNSYIAAPKFISLLINLCI